MLLVPADKEAAHLHQLDYSTSERLRALYRNMYPDATVRPQDASVDQMIDDRARDYAQFDRFIWLAGLDQSNDERSRLLGLWIEARKFVGGVA